MKNDLRKNFELGSMKMPKAKNLSGGYFFLPSLGLYRPHIHWLSFILLSIAILPISAHEGHDHGEGAPQENIATGPIILSSEAKQNLELQTAPAIVQAMEKTIKASGIVQAIPGNRENITSKISGKVAQISAVLGQYCKQGQTLLVIEGSQLSDVPIRISINAPRSGKIVKLNVIKGDAVEPGTALIEIAEYKEVYVVAKVFESQIGSISKNMNARVYSPFFKNTTLNSKVEIIGSEVNSQSRTVDVWLRVKNQDEKLKINMTVNIFFLAGQSDEAIIVPKMAVLGTGGERFVFVEEGNAYKRTSVVTGIENDQWIEIIEGLAPGDIVVTRGNYQLQFAKVNHAK